MFGDLEWPPHGDSVDEIMERCQRDPAFTVNGYSRWVAFARILGEIRYYAVPIPQGLPWYWTGEDPARVAAVDAEGDIYELAIVRNVSDAVTLTTEYLSGTPLKDISVPRIRPGDGVSQGRKG